VHKLRRGFAKQYVVGLDWGGCKKSMVGGNHMKPPLKVKKGGHPKDHKGRSLIGGKTGGLTCTWGDPSTRKREINSRETGGPQ